MVSRSFQAPSLGYISGFVEGYDYDAVVGWGGGGEGGGGEGKERERGGRRETASNFGLHNLIAAALYPHISSTSNIISCRGDDSSASIPRPY